MVQLLLNINSSLSLQLPNRPDGASRAARRIKQVKVIQRTLQSSMTPWDRNDTTHVGERRAGVRTAGKWSRMQGQKESTNCFTQLSKKLKPFNSTKLK